MSISRVFIKFEVCAQTQFYLTMLTDDCAMTFRPFTSTAFIFTKYTPERNFLSGKVVVKLFEFAKEFDNIRLPFALKKEMVPCFMAALLLKLICIFLLRN